MISPRLFLLQRLSAMVMAPLVLLHLAGMIVAIHGGLDAAEILGRTRGNPVFAVVYGLFVLVVSIHAAIGIQVTCHEWLHAPARALPWITWSCALLLLVMGGYAVYAVTVP